MSNETGKNTLFRAEHWEMDQEGQIKHSSSGVNYYFDDEHNTDHNVDVGDVGDHDVDDIQATDKDGDDKMLFLAIALKILLQAIVSMRTRTTRRSNCTLVPVLLGRFLLLFDTIW